MPLPRTLFSIVDTVKVFVLTAFMMLLLPSCEKWSQANQALEGSQLTGKSGDDEYSWVTNTVFCSPDRVISFEKKQNQIVNTSGFIERNPRVELKFDQKDLENGYIRCTINDCSIVAIKPINIAHEIPLALASISVEMTITGQKESKQPSEHKAIVTTQVNPLDLGILRVGVSLTGEYERVKKIAKRDKKDQIEFERRFNCTLGLNCTLPTLRISVGGDKKGLFFDVTGNTSMGSRQEFAEVSTNYLSSHGSIHYHRIPSATLTQAVNFYKYLTRTTLPRGSFVDPEWNEFVHACRRIHSRSNISTSSPNQIRGGASDPCNE